jgi:hypothetical protein
MSIVLGVLWTMAWLAVVLAILWAARVLGPDCWRFGHLPIVQGPNEVLCLRCGKVCTPDDGWTKRRQPKSAVQDHSTTPNASPKRDHTAENRQAILDYERLAGK